MIFLAGDERQDDSITARLIHDISDVFIAVGDEPLKTALLLEGLHRIEESPWGDWHGKSLSPYGLSRLLRVYRIKTMPVYSDGETVRGYKVEQFFDAFAQLGVRSVRSVRSATRSQAGPNAFNASNASTPEQGENGRPPPGNDGYLGRMFAAFEEGLITEGEWRQADRARHFVVQSGSAA